MDFTLLSYKNLLNALQTQGFSFMTFRELASRYPSPLSNLDKHAAPGVLAPPGEKIVCLRHDVDLWPQNALAFAQIQGSLGIRGSYYFRTVPESYDEAIILQIASLGHEIGYHYETMDTAARRLKGSAFTRQNLIDAAYGEFCQNLETIRKLASVHTICMHGSPRSDYDNKDIWEKYTYRPLGIEAEPYFDLDYTRVFYLTDTGRRWDGWRVSVRDKVPLQDAWIKKGWVYHSTSDLIEALRTNHLPHPLLMTFHPQRWTSHPAAWLRELLMQNAKNQVKRLMVKK